jgi:guanylate kinase
VLVVVAGPSGAGKGAVVKGLLQRHPEIWYSVSATTRAPRPGERDGVDYLFLTEDEFSRIRDEGGFLEAFDVYGQWKGTPKAPIDERLARGEDVLLEIDVQGALKVMKEVPGALTIFIKPPSRDEQRRRLAQRQQQTGESDEEHAERLAAAEAEEGLAGEFDDVVVNDDVDRAVKEIAAILAARRTPSDQD